MSDRLTLGVIGHVDHGKTALVRALTGVETDRLAEERRRGLSIVLGFAWLQAGARTVDLVDAPGHEAFVRTMVLGASGFDGAILAVAADEGVKPQTVEHLAIARVFGLQGRIVVAITKVDRLPAGRGPAPAALRAALGALIGPETPIVDTSAVSGEGMAELADRIAALPSPPRQAVPGGGFWLPIDRAFSKAGFGLVVTGTLHGSAVEEGAEVEISPIRRRAVVRQVQVHGERASRAEPGGRVALNLRHVGLSAVPSGALLASPGLALSTEVLEGWLDLDSGLAQPIRSGSSLRLMIGAEDVTVRLRLLGASSGEAGWSGPVRLLAERPVAVAPGCRFVLRTLSPRATVGGGVFLDLPWEAPPGRAARDREAVRRLAALHRGDPEGALRAALEAAGSLGRAHADVARWTAAEPGAAHAAAVRSQNGRWVARGAPAVPVPQRLEHAQIASRIESNLEAAIRAAGLTPPRLDDLPGPDAARREALRRLLGRGSVVRIRHAQGRDVRILHQEALMEAEHRLRGCFANQTFTVAAARDALQLTRRDTLPLLEHWDATGVTRRRAELRSFAAPLTRHGGD